MPGGAQLNRTADRVDAPFPALHSSCSDPPQHAHTNERTNERTNARSTFVHVSSLPNQTKPNQTTRRTDWSGVPALDGTASALDNLDSIHDKLFTLPSDTAIIPGKGPCSFIRVERNQNPYARQIRRRFVSYDKYLEERKMLSAEAEKESKERRAIRRRKVFGKRGESESGTTGKGNVASGRSEKMASAHGGAAGEP